MSRKSMATAFQRRTARQAAGNKCCGSAQRNSGNCDRAPTVTRDGKPYCWQHDPERLRAIRDQKFQNYLTKSAADDAAFENKLKEQRMLERISESHPLLLAACHAVLACDLPMEVEDQIAAAIAAAEGGRE